jgi:hypothetical protein
MFVMARSTGLKRGVETTCELASKCDGMNTDCLLSKVYVSFGGLLLYMDGPYALLNALRIDHVYLLMKK